MNGFKNSTLSDFRYITLFGGKGGVGKTTCSAAAALHFASRGEKTLLISSDPAPSLSDILEQEIGGREKPVNKVEGLYAVEISSEEILRRWKEKFGREFYEVFSSLTRVERVKEEIIDYIGTAPGIEELFMLDYIMGVAQSKQYDRLVWDTAPSGQALRHLRTPYEFVEHLGAAAKIYLSTPSIWERFKKILGKKSRRSPIEIILQWKGLAEQTKKFLSAEDTEFIVVTIPEKLGISQTERLLDGLKQHGIRVRRMIINHVIIDADCGFHLKRQEMQKDYLQFLGEKYKNMELARLPMFPYEIKGIERLREVEKILFDSPLREVQ